MRVTAICSEKLPIPPVLGGAVEQSVYEIALNILNPEISVISPWSEDLKNENYDQGIFYHVNIKAQIKRIVDVLDKNLPSSLNHHQQAKWFGYLNGVTDLLCKLNPDVLQVHNRPECAFYLRKQFPQKPLILCMHNEPAYKKTRYQDVRKIDHFIFGSQYLARRFAHHYPASKHKSTVIHNGMDLKMWQNHPHTALTQNPKDLKPGKNVLFVGRTTRIKGIHHLLSAIEIVQQSIPDIRLIIVGSPFFGAVTNDPFLKTLKDRAKKLGGSVSFTGYVDRSLLPQYYAAADITVLPSLFPDPFPKVVLESIASGTPIIASRRGGIPEAIDHGVDGYLIDHPNDPKEIAHLICNLLSNPEKRRQMGEAGREKIKTTFSLKQRLEKFQNFYSKLEPYLKPSNHNVAS